MIPSIAHFVWFGDVPSWVGDIVSEFKRHNPTWDVRLWSDYPDDTPDAIKSRDAVCQQHCQRADLMYVWLLYQYGGVCIDTDAVCLRSFDPLREYDFWTTRHSDQDARLTNGVMGSAPKSEGSEACFRYVLDNDPPSPLPRCYYGPTMLTELFDHQKKPGLTVLPHHYHYPYPWNERETARALWTSDDDTRHNMLATIKGRFTDGEYPFSVHLWGVNGSSHAKVVT